MMLLAGGIAEQIKTDKYEKGCFANFKSKPGIGDDLRQARQQARDIVKASLAKDGCDFIAWAKLQKAEDELLQKMYDKTFAFIYLHKDGDLEKVGQLVYKKKNVSGDEVYKAMGKERPKYDFEESKESKDVKEPKKENESKESKSKSSSWFW